MKTILYSLLILFVSFTFINESKAQTYIIIVNKSNAVESLSKKEVSDLFLKKSKWSDGSVAIPVDLASHSSVRAQFTQEIHGKSVSAIRSYWQQAAFSGTASAPPEKSSDSDVIDFVKNNPGAIGYVSSSANISSVKKLDVH